MNLRTYLICMATIVFAPVVLDQVQAVAAGTGVPARTREIVIPKPAGELQCTGGDACVWKSEGEKMRSERRRQLDHQRPKWTPPRILDSNTAS
jgi:hypothetical protein